MTYFNNLGQARVGWRIPSGGVTPSTLSTSIYAVWNADTLGTSLDTSIFRAYNGEAATVSSAQLSTNIFGVWNADALGTSLDTSIYGVYNGDNVNDSSGNARNGTNVNNVTFTTGKVGNAFTFNGSNYVSLPNNSFKFNSDFSISAWVNFGGSSSDVQSVFSNITYDGTYTYGYYLYYYNSTLTFQISNNSGSVQLQCTLINLFNSWKNIVITRKYSTGTKMYIDGVLVASNTNIQNPNYHATMTPSIGAANYGPVDNNQIYYYTKNNGKIDAVNIYNKELTESEITSLYNSGNGAEYPFSTQTLDSLNDAVGTNHGTRPTSTLTGGVPGPSFTTGKIGKAFLFDGINDYVALPNNSLNFPSTSFSVSFWVNLANITSGNYALVSNYANDGVHRGWIVGSLTSGKLYFGIYAPGIQETVTSATIAINTWYHVTCVYTPNQPTKTYINGTLDSTSSTSFNPSYTTTHYPGIGASKYNSSAIQQYVSNGTKIDAVNVWNRELSADEITALYNSGNGQQYPFSSVTLSNSILDSVNAQNGTNVGSVTFTTGKVGNAFTFNGSNYISLPDNSLNSLTGDFSVSCWVKINSSTGSKMIIGNLLQTPVVRGWRLEIAGTVPLMYIYDSVGGTTLTSGTSLGLGTWYHIVMTRKSSTQTRIFINGVGDISNTDSRNPVNDTTMYTTIGVNQYGPSNFSAYFNGSIDGLTVWNKVLTESEVFNLYNDGTGAEYPFTSQYLASLKDSVGSNDGTRPASTLTGGVPGPSFTTGKIGKAFTFDGINDIVRLPNNSLDLTGDFSISMWANWGRNNTSQILMSNFTIGASLRGWFIEHAAGQLRFRGFNSSGTDAFYIQYSYVPPLNTWVHYTFVHKNNSNKMYADGVLIGSDIGGSTHVAYDTPNYPMIGANQYNATTYQEFFLGKIDAVSVWNRELTASDVTELYNSGNGKQYPY